MYKVLLCEDEIATANALLENVDWTSLNMEVIGIASNGVLGVEIFDSKGADIVLTDIRMPVMDGLEMAKEVKEKKKDVKIVFFTSSNDIQDAIEAVNIKAEAYILKPFSVQDIVKVLINIKTEFENGEINDNKGSDGTILDDVSIITKVDSYISEHIYEKIKVNDIATAFSYSPNYLAQHYRQKTGMLINEKVVQEKMKIAVKLLEDRRISIVSIAEKLGYSDYSYFVKQFTEFYGVSPRIYRNNVIE